MHPLLLFTLLFLPGIIFVSCTLSVKKDLDNPFLDQAFSNGHFSSKRINLLMDILKGRRNNNNSVKNNGNIHRSVIYYTTPVDRSTGKSVPNSLVVQTIEYPKYNPNLVDKMVINGMSEEQKKSQNKNRGFCPWCRYLDSPLYKIEEPQGKSDFCPSCNRLINNERFHEHERCPCTKTAINDQIKLKNHLNIKNAKNEGITRAERTRPPVSIIMLIAGNKADGKKYPHMTDGYTKFDKFLLGGEQFHKVKKDDLNTSNHKNNKWTAKEEELVDLIAKYIKKQLDLKELEKVFDEIGNIKDFKKNKVSKKYISSSVRKSQNNDSDKKPVTNFDSVSFVDSERKNKGLEKKYGNEEPPFFESKNKLSKTNFDASIIKTEPIDQMNNQLVESTYSVKMDIKPIPQDELKDLKKSSIIGDKEFIGSNLNSYYGPFSLDSYKDNVRKRNEVGFNKYWYGGGKRNIKQDQTLLKNSDVKIRKSRSYDELEKNEVPHDELLINYKNNLSPKNVGPYYHDVISPVKVPTPESNDEIGTNLEGPSMKVKMPLKIVIPDNDKGNHEDFKVLTSDFGHDFRDQSGGKTIKIVSTNLPPLPLNNPYSKNVDEQTQLEITKPQLSGLPVSSPTHDTIPLNTSPKNNEDQSITLTEDNQTTTLDPHLEELSFWNKIRNSFIAPLLHFAGLA